MATKAILKDKTIANKCYSRSKLQATFFGQRILQTYLISGNVAGSLAASPLLTTKAQSSGPTIFVDGSGTEVQFKGIGW